MLRSSYILDCPKVWIPEKKGSPTQWIPWILFTEKISIKIDSCGDGLHMANLKFHFIFNVLFSKPQHVQQTSAKIATT